jgi:AcrR family transcriptional regulator
MAFEAQIQVGSSSFYAMKLDRADAAADRIRRAVVELLAVRGYEATKLEMVLDRANVTPDEFAREFESIEEAGIAAFDELAAHYAKRMKTAFERASGEWRDKLRGAAYVAARFLRDNPVDFRFGAYELMRVSEVGRSHRDVMLEPFVDMVDLGRHLTDPRRHLTRATAEATVGSIITAVGSHVSLEDETDPSIYVPQLMYVAVRPYLGLRAAEEELGIPPPPDADLRVG